ncbi:DUF397 domain-containing protein [Streptomyces uncialis]|uniref:DUF397 domain-containing protein n=1 Tax=Streptomyces uncialis TaxID=1048205 RepID=UPI0033C96FBE
MNTTSGGQWVTSSYSNGNGNCVEVQVRNLGESVAQRDSKQAAAGPVITHTREGWQAFVTGLRRGDLTS